MDEVRKLWEKYQKEEAARLAELERERLLREAMISQVPVGMQDLVLQAEATREVHDWLFDSGRDALARGQVERAALYAYVLVNSTGTAMRNPVRMSPLASAENLRALIEGDDGSMLRLGKDPLQDAVVKELVDLAARPGAVQAALDALYRLQTFGGWVLGDFAAGADEQDNGLDTIVASDVWLDILYHRWVNVEPRLAFAGGLFRDGTADSAYRDGLHALVRAACALCMYAMHRDPRRLEDARRALASATADIPGTAARAREAIRRQEKALQDMTAGHIGRIALPGADKLFEADIDPSSFSWTALLLGEQSTKVLPLDAGGATIRIPDLIGYVDTNPDLKARLPFELYDPRLSMWLGIGVSLTWALSTLAAYALSLKRWERCRRLLELCFGNVGLLPRLLRDTVEAQAVPLLVELARAWSADLYAQTDNAPDAERPALLEQIRGVIGLVAEAPAGENSVRIPAASLLVTSAIDGKWKTLIGQTLAPGAEPAPGLPAVLGPALTEIRRRVIYVSKGILAGGQFVAVAPLWRFEYLFDAASFFVGQAKYAEQRAADYRDRATSSKLQRQQLQDAIEMAGSELVIANKRIDDAQASVRIAEANSDLADARHSGATQRLIVYAQTSEMIRRYQAMTASLGGGSDGVFANIQSYVDAMRREGKTTGPVGYLMGANTYIVASYTGEIERTSLQSQVTEAGYAQDLAQRQLDAEHVREEIAQSYAEQAGLRLNAAQRLLQSFDADASSVTYNELTAFMKRIAEAYFTMAVDAAMAAQSAFNYQFRTEVELVSAKPRSVAEPGVMASEDLALKLAQFRFFQLRLGNRRRIPVRWEVKLQDIFPEAMQQLRTTGRCDFALLPEHLCNHFPGLFNVTVLQVGLKSGISNLPGRWVLTNSPKGVFRDMRGTVEWRDQTVEARLASFSDDVLSEEMLQARVAQNQLEPFENTSPLCTWSLRYAGRKADVDLAKYAVNLVMDLDAEFNDALADRDRGESNARLLASPQVTATTLGTLDPEALASLADQGQVSLLVPFSVTRNGIRENLFPEGAAELKMTGLGVRLLARPGVMKSLNDVEMELEVPCDPGGPAKREKVNLRFDATGAIDPASVRFQNVALPLGEFRITLKHSDGALNASGAKLSELADIAFAISYQVSALRT